METKKNYIFKYIYITTYTTWLIFAEFVNGINSLKSFIRIYTKETKAITNYIRNIVILVHKLHKSIRKKF